MYSQIVVGTDGSEPAWGAVRAAADLARLSGATLHVVRGVPRPVMLDAGLGGGAVAIPPSTEALDDASGQLEIQCGGLDVESVETHVVESSGSDAILDVAEAVGADLVVVGSRGMTGAKRFVLGSVPNAISHHAPCSVLIVKTD